MIGTRPRAERPPFVFDLIGKRRYAYVVSGVVTAVSLVFILLTLVPGGNLGLRFSIAYTGGTVWEVHFEGETPTPADVREVLEEHGLPGPRSRSRARTAATTS